MNKDTQDLIWKWQHAKDAIKEAQLLEDSLRSAVIAAVFSADQLDEGTHTAEIADGAKIACVQRYDRKVKTDIFESMKFSYETPVRLKIDLDKKAYDKLDAVNKIHFDQCIETKPSKPSLELRLKGEK